MISKLDQNRIAEATDIVQLIGGEIELKPQGKNLVACCPFHTEKTGSFIVNPAIIDLRNEGIIVMPPTNITIEKR